MSVAVSVYSERAYKEYILPSEKNLETSLVLKKELFGLRENAILKLDAVEQKWHFMDGNYRISKEEQPYRGEELKDQDSFVVYTGTGEKLYLIIKEKAAALLAYRKVSLRNRTELTVGSATCQVRYEYIYQGRQCISGEHAVFRKRDERWYVEDRSANGTFLNNRRFSGSQQLEYGDHISMWGLELIFLGDVLAVSPDSGAVFAPSLELWHMEEVPDAVTQTRGGRQLCHRAPRNIEPLDTEEVEIEAPPAPKEENDTPLLMQIGPALTMTLPMLLGSGMAVVSSTMSGAASTGFMYTGLITAGCSGILGVFWAMKNMNYAEKKRKQEETRRFEAYSQYLLKCTDKIRGKYERNIQILNDRYPALAESIGDGTRLPAELWGRNATHEDFLYYRLGLGDIPFQGTVTVPKEKFTLVQDNLAEKPAMIKNEYAMLRNVPVGVDLREHRLVGITGGENKTGAYPIVSSLAAQIITQNCYTDVKLVFIGNGEEARERWDFALWIPHVWSEDKKLRYVAFDEAEARDVFFELTNILRRRTEEKETSGTQESREQGPRYIMFIDDIQSVAGEAIEKYIFSQEDAGLTTILLAERYEQLPNACEYIIQNDGYFQGTCEIRKGEAGKRHIAFDDMSSRVVNRLARAMSNIEVNETETGGEIPSSVSFFDMYGIQRLSDLHVKDRWRKNRTYDSLKALIGQKAGGQPCFLDLHEKYHGPHGLVAGTTGSGKSETLQTYILSLALNFSPDDVGFFLIDYKGGGMGNLFSGLPHVLGQISNLSGSLIYRALVSIKSENLRRQRIFNENGVNNINLYTTLYKNGEVKVPVPHLFIIIDEFAELKKEEPEFMRELISVAQVGRSLGVHLILATQKPSGTVDDNIWSNAKFHICLRVQDRQDSLDMLHKPDAAYLTGAGRGYLQVGNDEIYEEFQSGWSGAAYDEDSVGSGRVIARMIDTTGKTAIVGNHTRSKKRAEAKLVWIQKLLEQFQEAERVCGDYGQAQRSVFLDAWQEAIGKAGFEYPAGEYAQRLLENLAELYTGLRGGKGASPAELTGQILTQAAERKWKLPEMKEKTQLDAVVEYLAKTAQEEGYVKQTPLWLPELPAKLYLGQNTEAEILAAPGMGGWSLRAEAGLCDDPANQMQFPLVLDFSEDANHAVCGLPMSGKSTFLQTVLYSLVNQYSADYLNLYILDFGSRMLEAFEEAPQTGGILYENNLHDVGRLFRMLERILKERKTLFHGGNYRQYTAKNGLVCPAILVVIDNMGTFREKTEDKYQEFLLKFSRECAANGIYLLISAASYGVSEIPNRLGENIRRTICLEMQDKYQYTDALGSMQIKTLPESGVPGRGLVKTEDGILEFQTCLAVEAEDDYQRMERIRERCAELAAWWKGKKARPVPSVPEKPVWNSYQELPEMQEASGDPSLLPVGYVYETAELYSLNLFRTYCYVISGKARTGKTNFLKAILRSAAGKDAGLCVVELSGNELLAEAENCQARYVSDCESYYRFILEILPVFQERNSRKKELWKQGADEEEIFANMAKEKPWFVLIADLSDFVKMIYGKDGEARGLGPAMTNLLEKGSLLNIYFAACMNWEKRQDALGKPVFEAFVSYKTGVHLGGAADDQRMLEFPGISMQEKSRPDKPGCGLAVDPDGQSAFRIVTPLVRR